MQTIRIRAGDTKPHSSTQVSQSRRTAVNWTKLDVPAVQSSDEGNFSFNEKEGLFIHTVKRSGPYGRSLAVATSTDFENWDDYGLVFHADETDQEMGRDVIEARFTNPNLRQTEYNTPEHYSVQIYNMGVFRYEGIYIGLPSMYHHTGKVPTDWPGFDQAAPVPVHLRVRQRAWRLYRFLQYSDGL